MVGQGRESLLQEVLITCGLFAVQCILGFYTVFLNHVLALGANPLFLISLAGSASAVFLLPFAVALERKKWPTKLSPALVLQIVMIALGGVTVFQGLMLMGMEKTSPAVVSAMPNLAPGFIFLIAACLRLEKFEKKCKYSRAKIMGTLVCLGGAMAMSLLQTPTSSPRLVNGSYNAWILGCSYLLAGVITLSFVTVLQAATLISFPAPLSLCVLSSSMGAAFTAILQLVMEGDLDAGPSSAIDLPVLMEIVAMGGVVVGGCVAYQTWCVGKKGPVLVSIFAPVQTVCSAILSAFILGQVISVGSVAGIVLMFCGLYVVLWAKNREIFDSPGPEHTAARSAGDIEKPLLS